MTYAVHDGSTGYHDHKKMDVFVGLTSVLPLQSPILRGSFRNYSKERGARLSFHYLRGHNFRT